MPLKKARKTPSLLESEAMLSAVVETAVDAMIVADGRGTVRSVNSAFTEMFGYTAEEVIGRNLSMLMPSPYDAEHDAYIKRYLETGEKRIIGIGREVVARRKDGRAFPAELSVSEARIGRRRLFTGIVRDITERKEAEEELRREKEKAQTYLDLAGVIMVALDTTGAVTLINRKGCEILGCESSEIIGKDWFDHFVPQRDREAIRKVFERLVGGDSEILEYSQTLEYYENAVLTRSGEERLVEWHNTLLRDDEDRVVGTLSSGNDVTERERMSQELLEKESLAKLGEMAAVVAHEVKNPIAGIGGALRIIGDRLPAGDEGRDIIKDILDRLDNLNNVVNDMLIFARPRTPTPGHVPLAALLEQAVSLLESDPEFSDVTVDVSGPDVTVSCDAELLKPVFVNLLVNAAQALEGKGTISVMIDPGTGGLRDGRCEISFIDSGPGIPPDVRRHIFEPFFTTKPSGTGLGLSIAKRIVELQGGSISVVCPPEGGTTVHVWIPRAP